MQASACLLHQDKAKPRRHSQGRSNDRLMRACRSALSVTAEEEENTGEGDFMKAFKVAHFTLASQEEGPQPMPDANGELKLNQPPSAGAIPQLEAPELAQSGPKEDKKFWEGLLRQQYADLQLQQAAALGKGKRKRNQASTCSEMRFCGKQICATRWYLKQSALAHWRLSRACSSSSSTGSLPC